MSKVKNTASKPEPAKNSKQAITLTKTQYFALLKTVYLGNWFANAIRDDSENDKRKEDYDVAESIIFSNAKQFGYSQYVADEFAEEGKYYPSRALEEEPDIMDTIDEYNECTFWDELVERLAEKDFTQHNSRAQIRAMSQNERIEKLYEFIDTWAEEINTNGLDNIGKVSKKA